MILALIVLLYIIFIIVNTEDIESFFMFSFIGGVILMVTALILFIFAASTGKEHHRDFYRVPIYSLKDGESLNGSFFLGSGGFSSDMKYIFFKKSGDGYIKDTTSALNTVIVESDDEEPNLSYSLVYKQMSPIMIPPFFSPYYSGGSDYKLTVPKGTIIKEYKVQ